MKNTVSLTVIFAHDELAITRQLQISDILERFGGDILASGMALTGPYAWCHDVQCDVSLDMRTACCEALRKAGFEVEESDDTDNRLLAVYDNRLADDNAK